MFSVGSQQIKKYGQDNVKLTTLIKILGRFYHIKDMIILS